MFEEFLNLIVEWFRDKSERMKLINSFNMAARMAFIVGTVPTLLKAGITQGERSYKHQFSDWLCSGLRIKALNGNNLTHDELMSIGETIISDTAFVRKLIVLGFDTLYVQGRESRFGLRWQLRDYLQLPE